METMACVDPEETFDTVSDSSPQERWMHAVVWLGMILALAVFWAFVAWLIFG